jgi:hypothetical protein
MLKTMRLVHLCLGIFFAPTIIFFSVTGGLQTFELHEQRAGADYQAPDWLAAAAEIHKNQAYKLAQPPDMAIEPSKLEGKSREEGKTVEARKPGRKAKKHTSQALKWMILFMAIGLTLSTLIGIYMAFAYNRDRRLILGLLFAGTVLPVALIYL